MTIVVENLDVDQRNKPTIVKKFQKYKVAHQLIEHGIHTGARTAHLKKIVGKHSMIPSEKLVICRKIDEKLVGKLIVKLRWSVIEVCPATPSQND